MSLTATARSILGTLRQEVVQLGGDLSDAQLERLERVARSCPLRRSIEVGFELVERLERAEQPSERRLVGTGAA